VVSITLPPRQHEVHAGGAHAGDALDGAGELAFQRARLVDRLLELRGGQPVAAIEDLVTDGPAGGQAFLGQQQAGARHVLRRDQHLPALRADLVGDVLAAQQLGDLAGLAQVQIAVQQSHARGSPVHRQHRQQAQHADRHRRHRAEPGWAESLQPVEQGAHAAPRAEPPEGASSSHPSVMRGRSWAARPSAVPQSRRERLATCESPPRQRITETTLPRSTLVLPS
jgi:hypothetical protein